MGSNLRRQLREALPPNIKGLQRAVALEIADDARYDDDWNYAPEKGRRSRVRLAELVRWTAAKDELSIREMLRRLSLAGWEFRLPIGKDRNGNLLYAVPGKAMTFRVPDFEGPTTVGPNVEIESEAEPAGPTTVGPNASGGPTGVGQGPTTVEVGPTVVGAGPTVVGAGPTVVGPPSPVSSFSTKESPSSSPVAEDSSSDGVSSADATEGGGGGSLSLEEITKQCERVDAFVTSLDFRGKQPGKQQRLKIGQRIMVAFTDGWTEHGLARYLDISDDPSIRSAAAVYLHRLSDDELPEASAVVDPQLPPACWDCLGLNPAAATDLALRINPITGDACPNCHPGAVGQSPEVPPACDACLEEFPTASTNVRMRYRVIDGENQACPDCHPKRIVVQAANSAADLFAPGAEILPGDRRVHGWYKIARQLEAEEAKSDSRVRQAIEAGRRVQQQQGARTGRNYSNDVWHQPADPAEAAKIPHCGDLDCDPVTRLKQSTDENGLRSITICGHCHPAMNF
ncbi:hypothetical protein [Streptomyces lincolnensis]|uniref:hypothetical protein n=1 Tax=Streptomyces lincolnensis TaxID=1915 RepID=UPI0037D1A30F